MTPPSRILIIRFSSLGDIVLTSPVTRVLRARYPSAEIFITVKRAYEPLARLLPGVDTVLPFEPSEDLRSLRHRVHHHHFDLMIDLHANIRSRLLTRFGGVNHVIRYRKRRIARMGMVYASHQSIDTRHTVDLYLDTLTSLGIKNGDRIPSLNILPAARRTVIERLQAHGITDNQCIIGLAPGASSPVKQWPASHFARLADQLQDRAVILLLGSEQDRAATHAVASAMCRPVVDWTGHIDLALLPAALAQCHVVVSNDSGPMHIASAVGTPVIGLFGPTHPRLGFTPLGVHDTALTLDMDCSPCSLHGHKVCWKRTHECMDNLPVERVVQAVMPHLL